MDLIMFLFICFVFSFGILIVLLGMIGISFFVVVIGVWILIFNIGLVFGFEVGLLGVINLFLDMVKWLMVLGMFLG